MAVEVLKPGLFSNIQDRGRFGFGKYGVPKSGAMDACSADFANDLLNNDPSSAVLEIAFFGPKLYFHIDASIAIAGLEAEILLNDRQVPINKPFFVPKESVLDIKQVWKGNWVYLAVRDGFQTPEILGSRSMHDGITTRKRLRKRDVLGTVALSKSRNFYESNLVFDAKPYGRNMLRAFPGPEFDLLSKQGKSLVQTPKFTVSKDIGRMAFPLGGLVEKGVGSMLTGPVLPGTVQLTTEGKLYVLMRDAQVTGGYPRILQLADESMDILAQKRPGSKIGFELMDF